MTPGTGSYAGDFIVELKGSAADDDSAPAPEPEPVKKRKRYSRKELMPLAAQKGYEFGPPQNASNVPTLVNDARRSNKSFETLAKMAQFLNGKPDVEPEVQAAALKVMAERPVGSYFSIGAPQTEEQKAAHAERMAASEARRQRGLAYKREQKELRALAKASGLSLHKSRKHDGPAYLFKDATGTVRAGS